MDIGTAQAGNDKTGHGHVVCATHNWEIWKQRAAISLEEKPLEVFTMQGDELLSYLQEENEIICNVTDGLFIANKTHNATFLLIAERQLAF